MKKLLPLLVIAGLFVAVISMASAEAAKLKYGGLSTCKACHSSAKMGGEEYKAYEKSKHAAAFKTLSTDKAKEVAKAAGVADPTKDPKCLKCHTTAYGKKDQQGEKYSAEEGVTCEACHGPGENYKSMPVMKDHAKSVAAGLLVPNEKTCLECHNDKSPTYKAFDYKKAWAIMKHGPEKTK